MVVKRICCVARQSYSSSGLKAVRKLVGYKKNFFFFNHAISSLTGKRLEYVTCGSVAKLYNVDVKVRLHSHDVKYGAGSGQQSVTGTELSEDINSHWQIKAATGQHCKRG